MSLISAKDLAKAYGPQDVFQGVSLAIPRQARIGLLGPNGVGKTTLLKLLAGQEKPDRGAIQRARNLKIGYLPQAPDLDEGRSKDLSLTLWEATLAAFGELRKQEAELQRLEEAMADPRRAEEAMAKYGPFQEAFERAGGYTYAFLARRVLNGLGLGPKHHESSLAQLSGGERTRAQLARLLLEDPDLLLLDEPTNHLDLDAVEWLEDWFVGWPGAAVIVSHDRYFLDRTVTAIWDLSPGGLEFYRGNYSAYDAQKESRRRTQVVQYAARQEHIRKEQEYIRRNIAGQNARQAQGRRKRLERLLREEELEKPRGEQDVLMDFGKADRSGDRVLETERLAVGHPGSTEPLLSVPDLVLRRGECAALIGPNGAGKTTFVRTILGEIPAWSGSIRLGASLSVGYLPQGNDGLVGSRTVLEELTLADPDMHPSRACQLLAGYLLSGDDVDKQIEVLSGGERARLALAKLSVQGANLLLLDEPTTHLDHAAQEALQEALAAFPGTILLVSHDRYLIDALAIQIWVASGETGMLRVFRGNYAEYVAAKQKEAVAAQSILKKRRSLPSPKVRSAKARELEAVEAHIAQMEAQLSSLSEQIGQSGKDVERVKRLGSRYAAVQAELEGWIEAWERLAQSQRPP